MKDMTKCQAQHCTEDAWTGAVIFPLPVHGDLSPFRLCARHWNTDGHHPIVVVTEPEGVPIYHIWPNPPDDPWRLSNA